MIGSSEPDFSVFGESSRARIVEADAYRRQVTGPGAQVGAGDQGRLHGARERVRPVELQ